MGELSQRAPVAPAPDGLSRRPPPQSRGAPQRRRLAFVALLVTVVGGAITLQLIDDHSSTPVATGTVPSSNAGGQGALPADVPLPEPTFLTVATPPEGLRFIEGGSRATGGPSGDILLADASGRYLRLVWRAPSGCASGTPRTSVRGATDAPAEAPPVARSSDEAPFVPDGNARSLHWCQQGRVDVNLIAGGIDEATTRRLARSVERAPGSTDQLIVAVPSGFVAGRPDAKGRLYRLVFRPDDTTSSRPQLFVSTASAWTTDLHLLGAQLGGAAAEVDVGGHKGLLLQAAGGARYQELLLVYDERTVVTLAADGLTPDQLLSAAASLHPADPSLAPDVSGDPGRCQRVGLCG